MLRIKSCLDKTIIKYGIIISILFIILFFMCNFILTINKQLSKERENEIYRTIYVVPINEIEFNKSIDEFKDNIEIITNDFDEYYITFKEYKDVNNYLNKYSNIFSRKSINNEDIDSKFSLTKNVIYTLVIIVSIIVIILIFIFSYNIIYNLENDIALYKLIGYKNKNIILSLCFSLYLFYFIMYNVSYLIVYILYIFLLNKIAIINNITNTFLLNITHFSISWLIISIPIFCSYIRIIKRITSISPIKFIKGD